MSVTYNLANRNKYEKSVITKKLRIDKKKGATKYFFFKKSFFRPTENYWPKNTFFLKIKTIEDMKFW